MNHNSLFSRHLIFVNKKGAASAAPFCYCRNIQYTPTSTKAIQTTINTLANFSKYIAPYTTILAPIINDKPTDIVKEIKPTAILPFSISSSTLNIGVKNSYK